MEKQPDSDASRERALRMDLGWNDGASTMEQIVAAGLGGLIAAIVYVGDVIRERGK